MSLATEHQRALLELVSRVSMHSSSNWNWKCWFLWRDKMEESQEKPLNKDKNQQQTQPTYGINARNQIRDTSVGGECSCHCTTPARQGLAWGLNLPQWAFHRFLGIANFQINHHFKKILQLYLQSWTWSKKLAQTSYRLTRFIIEKSHITLQGKQKKSWLIKKKTYLISLHGMQYWAVIWKSFLLNSK